MADINEILAGLAKKFDILSKKSARLDYQLAYSTDKKAPVKTFFDLPFEIRNIIYKMAIPRRTIHPQVFIKMFTSGREAAGIKNFNFPAMALTVSKVYEREASNVFYGHNTFAFESVYECFFFLRSIGKIRSAIVRSIKVTKFDMRAIESYLRDLGEPSTFQDFLADYCINLRRLEFFEVNQKGKAGAWRMPELEQIEAFRTVPDLPKAHYNPWKFNYNGGTGGTLCFLAEKQLPKETDGAPFDVEHEMKEVKSATKARRLVGAQKAQATKTTNQTIIAAGGPAAEALIKAATKRRANEKRRADARKAAMAKGDDSEDGSE